MCKKLIKNSQPFGKKFQKTVGGIFLTHTVGGGWRHPELFIPKICHWHDSLLWFVSETVQNSVVNQSVKWFVEHIHHNTVDVCVYIEAGNVLLQKLLVTKGMPDNCVFIGIDQNGHVCPVTYVSRYQYYVCFLYRILMVIVTLFVTTSGAVQICTY